MGVAQKEVGGNTGKDSLDGRITQDEVVSLIAYGIKLRNSLHGYVFDGVGYEKSAALVASVVSEYLKQMEEFMDAEEDAVPGAVRHEGTGASDDAVAAAQMSEPEYEALTGNDLHAYGRHIAEFAGTIGLERIAGKQTAWELKARERKRHFQDNGLPDRSLFDYNASFFVIDGERLASEMRNALAISAEDLPVYVHDFSAFAADYASIAELLTKGCPF